MGQRDGGGTSPCGGRSRGVPPRETALKAEDFMAPNPVLCYGAGIMSKTLVSTYQRAGFHIVGMIDKYKNGFMETEFGSLPICSIDSVVREFGEDVVVIITISNAQYYPEIEADLTNAGVSKERIYDWNSFNWMTVPSSKCYCHDLFQTLRLGNGCLLKCCNWGDNRSFNVELFSTERSFEECLESFAAKMRYYYERALEGEVPLQCVECPYLEDRPLGEFPRLDALSHSMSAQCNAECVYCSAILETDLSKLQCDAGGFNEMFLQMLCFLEERDLIAPGAGIDFAGGEITITPRRKELLRFAMNHPEYHYSILSNCAVYNEDIAKILDQSPDNKVLCDLDAGTPETYTLVKGFNYFDSVVNNLKKYVEYGHVELKYIVMPDFNVSQTDFDGTVQLLKRLGLTRLYLSQDFLHSTDLFMERRTLFAVGKFKMILEQNGIEGIFFPGIFNERQRRLADRFYKQLTHISKGSSAYIRR